MKSTIPKYVWKRVTANSGDQSTPIKTSKYTLRILIKYKPIANGIYVRAYFNVLRVLFSKYPINPYNVLNIKSDSKPEHSAPTLTLNDSTTSMSGCIILVEKDNAKTASTDRKTTFEKRGHKFHTHPVTKYIIIPSTDKKPISFLKVTKNFAKNCGPNISSERNTGINMRKICEGR